ncbi:MAG: NADH:flavin oxidoreductase/NADH oxidase family protein [Porticoccaceae bacterium]|nr:NADH:flavin oxidoreductase/NADH oxidase family protein [Porticoccaceae bacterium]MDG1749056.1 NADH:flavin oxidoreductase/NADH oxidase family protein [Porticoccaceae bacterium]
MTTIFNKTISLPCGAVLSNRFAKAAMTEGLAGRLGVPGEELCRLYEIWSDGGAGMLLSGNIMVDRHHLERPGNVVIDRPPDLEMRQALKRWASSATRKGNHFWAQISHAGRQTQKMVNAKPKAPSAVKLALPGGQFGEPVELNCGEIEDIISRFGICAAAVKEAGFTGVQVHAAHGYLLSQFLSPRSNRRPDEFGGALANRARPLLAIIEEIRSTVGPDYPISVKLNSADFQKGGFAFEDSLQVAKWLEAASVDLIEISGGTYEQPKLLGIDGMEEEENQNIPASTLMREAYFVDFAMAMRKELKIPLMVTGGFRQSIAMKQAIESGGADVIGLGRPMCVMTDAPNQLLNGIDELPRYESQLALFPKWLSWLTKLKILRTVSSFAVQYWYYGQIDSLGRTGKADPDLSVWAATKQTMVMQKKLTR